jgi:hypothetical protein
MGPRCSSAETQVCHRSYIIAASVDPIIHNKFTFIVPHTLQKYMLDVYCDILANLD